MDHRAQSPSSPRVRFGPYVLDVSAGELLKGHTQVKLQNRPLAILELLIRRAGEPVSRLELRDRLWPDGTFVDFENNISSAVGKLRAALNDSAAEPKYIETVGRRGYRFIADVEWLSPQIAPVMPQPDVPERRFPQRRSAVAVSVVLCLLAAAILFGWQQQRRTRDSATDSTVMLAVLPFANLTGDANQEYLSEGMTEQMVATLGKIDPGRVQVIARTSVMHYKNTTRPLRDVARELGVQYLLDGSVRRQGSKVRITAQFIDAGRQTQLWSREYDRELHDLLQVQDEIAQSIAREIRHELHDAAPPASAIKGRPSASYEAYDHYLRGRYLWNRRTRAGFEQAIQEFQKSIALDPQFAPSYAGLADAHALMSSYGFRPPQDDIPHARAAALRALELDPALANAHVSLALIRENYDWDWIGAEQDFRRAIELDPNYATAHHWYAEFLAYLGRFEEALAAVERARKLDPLSLIIAVDRGAILYYARQYDRAVQQLSSLIDLEHSSPRAWAILAVSFAELGRFAEALEAVEMLEESEGSPWAPGIRAQVLYKKGDRAAAARALAESEKRLRSQGLDVARTSALVFAIAGDADRAMAVLEKAYAQHSTVLTTLKVDPAFDPIRADPRFQELLLRVRLLK